MIVLHGLPSGFLALSVRAMESSTQKRQTCRCFAQSRSCLGRKPLTNAVAHLLSLYLSLSVCGWYRLWRWLSLQHVPESESTAVTSPQIGPTARGRQRFLIPLLCFAFVCYCTMIATLGYSILAACSVIKIFVPGLSAAVVPHSENILHLVAPPTPLAAPTPPPTG